MQIDATAQRLHPVLQTDQAGAAGEFGTADTVIGDLEPQGAVGLLPFDGAP